MHSSLLWFRACSLRRMLPLAALVAVFALSTSSWATSCSGFITLGNSNPQVTCTMPNLGSQQTMDFGMQHLAFANHAQGMVLVYNSSLQLSDVVTFTNVNGVATINFTADITGSYTPPALPVLASYTQGPTQSYTFLSLLLSDGKALHVGICTSTASGCNGGADSVKISVGNVPEPGTFFLLGTGVFGSGAWAMAKGALARRFRRKQIQT